MGIRLIAGRTLLIVAGLAVAWILVATGLVPAFPAYISVNDPLPEKFSPVHFQTSEEPFIGIAISGGGSRAAAFGAAVLQELDQIGLLEHVDVLSTVSGGGLPGAYFAIHGKSIRSEQDWDSFHEQMRKPFRTKLFLRALRPDKLLLQGFTHFDRSDVMAEVLDDELFDSATFARIGGGEPRRPRFIPNATWLDQTEPKAFPFTAEMFGRFSESRLDNYPIARAVTASAAFPGVFNTVTLTDHRGAVRDPRLGKRYHHFIDGGASDNLGVDTLFAEARRLRGGSAASKFACLVVLVDAYPRDLTASPTVLKADYRGSLLDYVVDSNFMDAFDALLIRRRESALRELGFRLVLFGPRSFDHDQDPAWPSTSIDMSKFFHVEDGHLTRAYYPYERVVGATPIGRGAVAAGFPNATCLVWHIAMSEVASFAPDMKSKDATPTSGRRGPTTRDPVAVFRNRLAHLAGQVKTDFDLVGPPGCMPRQLSRF